MRIGRSSSDNRTRVAIVTADGEFERSARATFGASSAIELAVVAGALAEQCDTLDVAGRHRRRRRSRRQRSRTRWRRWSG